MKKRAFYWFLIHKNLKLFKEILLITVRSVCNIKCALRPECRIPLQSYSKWHIQLRPCFQGVKFMVLFYAPHKTEHRAARFISPSVPSTTAQVFFDPPQQNKLISGSKTNCRIVRGSFGFLNALITQPNVFELRFTARVHI